MSTRDDVRAVVDQAILDQPRSLQKAIGPSEIGTECDRCLGHKLAGTEQRREAAWLPYVGTAMHAQLEQVFLALPGRWVSEERLMVGHIDSTEIWGHSDLYDMDERTVVDFKLVGKTTLDSARSSGPSQQYRRQAHLYGRGWQLYGFPANAVAIWYLPRNAVSLDQGVWWQEPYDETIAVEALARADALAQAIRMLGADAILPTLERAPACYDCSRFPAYSTDPPAQAGGPFADLAQPQQEGTLV